MYKKIIFLLLVSASSLFGMEPAFTDEKGKKDIMLNTVFHTLLEDQSLEKAAKNVSALSKTNARLHKIVNTKENTRLFLKKLAHRYTHDKQHVAANILKTARVADLLYDAEYPNIPLRPADELNYVSLLPNDIYKDIIGRFTNQKLETTLTFLKTSITDRKAIADDFGAITFLAQTCMFDNNKTNALIAAATLLDTPHARAWANLFTKTAAQKVLIDFCKAKVEFNDAQMKEFLKSAARQNDNRYIKAEASWRIAQQIYDEENSKSDRYKPFVSPLVAHYAEQAADQKIESRACQEAQGFCRKNGIGKYRISEYGAGF